MFLPPRFVVIDDTRPHLDAILQAFQDLGSPCLGIHFQPEVSIDAELLRGVRGLFIDLHLLGGPMGTDDVRDYANIVRILEDNISPLGGPFVLIVWTRYQDRLPNLTAYINLNLDPEKPWARPLVILALDKDQFINLQNGNTNNSEELKAAVEQRIASSPQLAALLTWESEVFVATGATLAALLDLIPDQDRTTDRFSNALDVLLSHLTVAAVGQTNVAADKRTAFMSALAPLLSDRVQNQRITEIETQIWDAAITQHGAAAAGKLPAPQAGQVNQMLHIALHEGEDIRPTDWGAVVEFPDGWKWAAQMEERFGVLLSWMLEQEFKIPVGRKQECRIRLIRIGAVCDHAQGKRGPLPYVFAVEVPSDLLRASRTPAIWRSPVFVVQASQPFILMAHSRFVITPTKGDAEGLLVRYRLREQLLMQLVSHSSGHTARPGILEIEIKT